jgi:hypothetical protein
VRSVVFHPIDDSLTPIIMNGIFRLLVIYLAFVVTPLQAAFHLWTMGEVYSNADGTVQFLELNALSGGQQFMSGQRLTVTPTGGGPRVFTFPNDLPGGHQRQDDADRHRGVPGAGRSRSGLCRAPTASSPRTAE